MSDLSDGAIRAPHRFFRAMVLMGGSIALGCDGSDPGDPGDASTDAGPRDASDLDAAKPIDPSLCPSEQWTCGQTTCADTVNLTAADCSCDFKLPKSSDDCEADELFICRGAVGDASPFERFQCACVPKAETCEEMCFSVYGGNPNEQKFNCSPSHPATDAGSNEVLCGCAWVYLL